jgi:hypothetical protein
MGGARRKHGASDTPIGVGEIAPPAQASQVGRFLFVAGGGVAPEAMANATPSAEGDSAFRRATRCRSEIDEQDLEVPQRGEA